VHQVGFSYIDISKCTVNKTLKKVLENRKKVTPCHQSEVSLVAPTLFPLIYSAIIVEGVFCCLEPSELSQTDCCALSSPLFTPYLRPFPSLQVDIKQQLYKFTWVTLFFISLRPIMKCSFLAEETFRLPRPTAPHLIPHTLISPAGL